MAQILDLGKLRFNWAGEWTQAGEYEYNDVVKYGPNVYAYVAPNSAIGILPTDTSRWLLVIEGVRYRGTYTADTAYFVNDIVTDEFSSYIVLTQHTATSAETSVPELTVLAVGAGSLPAQQNNSGKVLSTDGVDAEWVTTLELDKVSVSEGKGAQAVAFEADNGLTDVTAIFTASTPDFAQLAVANTHNGANASTDIIAYTADGDNDSGWIDMGITSKDFSAETFGITGPHDGYIFMSAPRVDESEITAYKTTASVAELETLDNHMYQVGQEIHVENVGPNYDGIRIITAVPDLKKFRFAGDVENQVRSLMNPYGAVYRPAGKGNLVLATDGTGTENKIVIAAGGFVTGRNQMVITPDVNVHIEIDTDSTSPTTGALTIKGGVGVEGDIYVAGDINIAGSVDLSGVALTPIGPGANDFAASLTNPTVVAQIDADDYAQIAFRNTNSGSNASTDIIAYADNGTDNSGYIDMGIASSTFSDPDFTITGVNDGYIFYVAPEGTTGKGNLVLATDGNGSENGIVFAAGGLASNNVQMKITPNESVTIAIDTPSVSPTTGALVVNGGVGIVGDVNIQGSIVFGGEGTQVGSANLAVNDPMIFVGADSTSLSDDLALVGESRYVIDVTWTKTVVNKVLTNNVATLTLTEDHGAAGYDWEVGDTVVVTGVGSPFDGSHVITEFPTSNRVSFAVTSVNVPSERVGDVVVTVAQKELLENVATLHTAGFHDLVVGETIVVANVDATFNGTHVITAADGTAKTFSFALVSTNVALTAATGAGTVNRSESTTVVENPIRTRWTAWSKDAVDGTWKLTSNLRAKPSNQVDYSQADIVYDRIKVGSIEVTNDGIQAVGASSVTGTLDVSSTFRVNSNKFQVASTTGNTTIAGKVNLAGNLEVATDKFVVDAVTGDTTIAGNAAIAGNLTITEGANTLFKVDGTTGVTEIGEFLTIYGSEGSVYTQGDLAVGVEKFFVTAADGNVTTSGTLETGGNVIINATPTNATDATTVGYVRSKAIGTWSTKTANYTAVQDDFIWANTSAGAFTVTLPATPADNDKITIGDVAGSWATNKLTLGRNGKTIMGLAEDLVLDIKNITVEVIYSGSTYGWRIV